MFMILIAASGVAQEKPMDVPVDGPAVVSLPELPVFLVANPSFNYTGVTLRRVQSTLNLADPHYRRQTGDCGGLSDVGTAAPYETITITNQAGIAATIRAYTSNIGDPTLCLIDSFLTAYSPSFAPANSSINCVTSNNDAGDALCSDITFTLAPGQTTVIVASSHENSAHFGYQVNFESSLMFEGVNPVIVGELTAQDGTYNRQAGDCGGLSGVGTNVFYDTVTLTNKLGELLPFDAFTSNPGDLGSCTFGDSFISVYSPSFDPADPVSNCVTSNDDGGVGVCSAVSFVLAAEKTATIVVGSFGNGSTFGYGLNVSSPVIFLDGFESGNTGNWSFSVP